MKKGNDYSLHTQLQLYYKNGDELKVYVNSIHYERNSIYYIPYGMLPVRVDLDLIKEFEVVKRVVR